MPEKLDPDSSPGIKLLKIFRKLLLNGRRYYQNELAQEYRCSPQTIIRIMGDIESVIGTNLQSGLENRRRWYQISSPHARMLGLDFEELRYLSVCRDLAARTLPPEILSRVDDTIFNLSLKMAGSDTQSALRAGERLITFFSKGRIDYSDKFQAIEKLLQAVENKLVCLVRYKALGRQEAKEHRFIPNRLVSMNQALYALGAILNEDYASVRHFINLAVHRMEDVTLTDKRVEIEFPELSSESFGLPWHEPRAYRIYFKAGNAAEYVAERIWSETQKIEKQDDGSVILQITTCSEPELLAWVRSFGEEAQIVP